MARQWGARESRHQMNAGQDLDKTGRLGSFYERGTVGGFELKGKAKTAFEKAYGAVANERGYAKRWKLLDLIREHYQEDPTNPSRQFAKFTRREIVKHLGIPSTERGRLKFFTAVGTALDHFHGVDAWFEYEHNTRGTVVVTIDVTQRQIKESTKADILVHSVHDPSTEKDEFATDVEHYGKVIAQQLYEGMKRDLFYDRAPEWLKDPSAASEESSEEDKPKKRRRRIVRPSNENQATAK